MRADFSEYEKIEAVSRKFIEGVKNEKVKNLNKSFMKKHVS